MGHLVVEAIDCLAERSCKGWKCHIFISWHLIAESC